MLLHLGLPQQLTSGMLSVLCIIPRDVLHVSYAEEEVEVQNGAVTAPDLKPSQGESPLLNLGD